MSLQLTGVMETLLITLYIRAKDSSSPSSVLHDTKAAEMVKQLDYDFHKFDSGTMSYYGVLARAKIMDKQVRNYINRYPDCTIVSVPGMKKLLIPIMYITNNRLGMYSYRKGV